MPKEWINSSHKVQIEKTTHNIRCRAQTIKDKQKRIYPDDQYWSDLLF